MSLATKSRARRITSVLAAAVAALMLAGCGASNNSATSSTPTTVDGSLNKIVYKGDASKSPAKANQRDDTFVTTIGTPSGVFLPYFQDNGWDGNATQPIFNSLVVVDNSGNVKPDLAEKWDISSDGLTYTYHLRKGLKFSDGSPLTAKDVAFTLTLLNDPAYSGGADFTNIGIKGVDEYKNGNAKSISGIKVVDDQTITIETTKVNPLALQTLGGSVLSKAYYGKDYKKGKLDYLKDLYSKPMGDGPYQLSKYVDGQEIRYKANKYYYGGKPKIENLIFKVTSKDTALANFQNGETDDDSFTPDQDNLDQLKSFGFATIRESTVPDISEIWLNNKNDILKDKKVRQALVYGLDRQQIVDVQLKGFGQVANVYAAPTQWSYTEKGVPTYKYNADKAKKLLDEAGWREGSDGIRVKDGKKLTLRYLTSKSDDPVVPIATENYKAIGVNFQPEVLDGDTIIQRWTQGGDWDMVGGFRTNGLVDPDDAINEFYSTNTSVNLTGYDNAEVTKLAKEGIATQDKDKRKEIYAELYKKLGEDVPTILVSYRQSLSAWNARIKNAEDFSTGSGDSSQALAKLEITK
ncbi:ABC transporter substrate-binding protein [Bifidobacterium leontopitheci]|uniref:ABC transporter substrate-binding protein n=1 Tax=Bifidobacterium leontopitheci TaxID=2650774 RepID=A0A6I1GF18_9BIFI|nr:ABC transporter substrate-binding protein [Bifidobacterium leontopitheci]KAB7790233.1 ABC transporter substrate-binding protein [Bifidobacterium leontopitheci]